MIIYIYIYIYFFFLRCSEYISKTGATGVIKDEATNINSSLSLQHLLMVNILIYLIGTVN